MAYEAYLGIKGSRQGQFKGQGKQRKWVPVLSFNMGVQSPRDAATGQASGKRQHKPIVVGITWGDWSPQIFSAMATNEVLDSVVIQIQGGGGAGSSKQTYEWIKLSNAIVTDISTHSTKGGGSGTQVQDVSFTYQDVRMGTGQHTMATDDWELERVAFTFQKISLSHSMGKAAFADDWTV